MTKSKLAVYIASIVALVCMSFGIWLDVHVYPGAFEKSGVVITCVGIVFGLMKLTEAYQQEYDERIEELEKQKEALNMAASDSQIENREIGSVEYYMDNLLANKENNVRMVIWVDGVILIGGTLISGFGNLLTSCF